MKCVKLEKIARSMLSVMLCLSMIFMQAVPAMATEEEAVVQVTGSRMDEEECPEETIVYFGTTSLTAEETRAIYQIPVYRSGKNLPEEDVTIHTMDLTALYGKDYELKGKEKQKGTTGTTILEMLTGKEATTAESAGKENEETAAAEQQETASSDILTTSGAVNAATASTALKTGENVNYTADFLNSEKTGKSKLALWKEEQTGQPTRQEGSSGLPETLTEAMLNQLMPEVLEQIVWSCEQKIHFEEGEDEAVVSLRILADTKAEGPETFSLVIVDAESSSLTRATTLSVVINDDEAPEYSELSLDKENYIAENNLATIRVTRTEALSSLCTAVLKGIDTESGEETTYGEVVFMPYEETKEVSLTISRETQITLCEMTGAVAGENAVTAATILPEETLGEESDAYEILKEGEDFETELLSSGAREFQIKFKDSKTYQVKAEEGKAYGIIYDTTYKPEVEAGIYILPGDGDDGWFSYNHYDGNNATWRSSEYDSTRNYGILTWYHTWIGNKGKSYTEMTADHDELLGTYYQYISPEWEQTRKFGGGQVSKFSVQLGTGGTKYTASHEGEFDKFVYGSQECFRVMSDSYLHMTVTAEDETAWRTPKLETHLYGVACMYKRFRVTWENPQELEFKEGKGTVKMLPLQFSVDSGAETGYSTSRDFFANIDENKSVLSVTTGMVQLSDNTYAKCGKIVGYRLTLEPSNEKKRVILNYPEDYYAWLKKNHKTDSDAIINAVEKEKLLNICYDKFFLQWIASQQKGVIDDSFGHSYFQNIHLTPIVDYVDVQVKVVYPEGVKQKENTTGYFTDEKLKEVGSYTCHIGDKLDLSCETVNDDLYQVIGYQYSTDGGSHFTTVTDGSALTLLNTNGYIIRPVITENVNGIEVQFKSGAENYLELENQVVSQSELEQYPTLKGHNYLVLNPEGKTVMEKIRVIPGKVYSIKALVKRSAGKGKAYRPVFTDRLLQKSFNGQCYYLTGRQSPKDNIIEIGVETVDTSSLTECSLEGYACTATEAIQKDAAGKYRNPAFGYTAELGNGQETKTDADSGIAVSYVKMITASVEEDGSFALNEFTAKEGDQLSVLFTSGLQDEQVAYVTVQAGGGKQNLGIEELKYPECGPDFDHLTYRYSMDENNKGIDVTHNSIQMKNDSLKITAFVKANGRNVTKAVFRSVNRTGAIRTFTAPADASNPGIFEVTLPNILNNFSKGETLQVYLVEETEITVDGKKKTVELEYPVRQTGYYFYTKNELTAPKTFDIKETFSDCEGVQNIPLIGSAVGNLTSGPLNLSRIDWPEEGGVKGYSIVAGLDMLLYETDHSSTPKEKYQKIQKYKENAQKVVAGREAEQSIKKRSKIPETGERQQDILSRLKDDGDDIIKMKEGNDALAQMNDKKSVTWKALLCLDLEFILNQETNQYMLASFAVTAGASASVNKTFYSVIWILPCYLDLTGSGNLNLTMGGVMQDAKDAMSAGQFGAAAGNIKEMLSDKKGNFTYQIDFTGQFKMAAGVGVCGILGARGFVSVGLELQGTDNKVVNDRLGALLFGKGGFGLDVLVGSFDVDIIDAEVGWGSLKGKTKVTMFNDLEKYEGASLTGAAKESSAKEEESSEEALEGEISEEEIVLEETLVYRELESGSDPTEGFDTSEASGMLGATPEAVTQNVLLEDAAQYTRPQLLDLGDGRQFLVFTGASDEGQSVLYYTVCSKNGKWQKPVRVYEGSYQDAESSLLLVNDQVYIAWQCMDEKIGEDRPLKERLAGYDLKLAVYDTETGKMGQPLKLTDNDYLPVDPHLTSLDDHQAYCTYLLVDYSNAQEDEDYLDIRSNYTAVAYTEIQDGKAIPFDKGGRTYLEHFVSVPHQTLTDPLITDFQAEAIRLTDHEGEDHNLLVAAYSIDEDNDSSTSSDAEIYLKVTELKDSGNKAYEPIRLTENASSDAFPQLTKLTNGLYLSWANDADRFCLMDIRSLLSAFFAPSADAEDDASGTMNKSIKNCFAQASGWDWYQKSADDLGLIEEDSDEVGFCYEGSIYSRLAEDQFDIYETDLGAEDDNAPHAIQEHQLATDGTDIYVFYTDMVEEFEDVGVELFGLRFQPEMDAKNNDGESEELRRIGFSDPVQITNADEAHDEISLFMTSDRQISMVSNLFTQAVGEDGIEFDHYKLVHTSFVSGGSVEIEENSLKIPSDLVPGQTEALELSVVNAGLYPTEGFHLEVTAEKDGITQVIESKDYTARLDTNESMELLIPWEVPENAEDMVITAVVKETGTAREHTSRESETVETPENLVLFDLATELTENGKLQVTAQVRNEGNKNSEAHQVQLMNLIDNEEGSNTWKEEKLEETTLRELVPGEEAELVFLIEPEEEYFDELGEMEFSVKIMEGETELETAYANYVAGNPLKLELNEGQTDLYVKKGESSTITAEAHPWSSLAGEVYFAVADGTVASVSEDGTVKGLKKGTTVVTAYCLGSNLSSDISIHVDEKKKESSDDEVSFAETLPAYVISKGSWQMKTDGNWIYLLSGSPVTNGWYCIYNPYADPKKKQKTYAWFYFDENGMMKTGWLTDTDGNRYYLNPVSDGEKGAMVTGWKQIDGKMYYFSEKAGSGTCGALQQ